MDSMPEQTVLDEADGSVVDLAVDDEAAVLEPPVKKVKAVAGSCKDGVRWLQSDDGITVPFILRAETGIVHCGAVEMQVLKSSSGKATVLCLTGCAPLPYCACFCHMLQKYYDSRR